MSFSNGKIKGVNEIFFPINTEDHLNNALEGKRESFPLLNNGDLAIQGILGETGVVLTTSHNGFDGVVVASLPHPKTRLKKIGPNGEVVFGGIPTNKALEAALEIPIGKEKAARKAKIIMQALKMNNDFSELSVMFNGMGAIGSEPEAWVIDPQTGDLTNVSGVNFRQDYLRKPLRQLAVRVSF